MTERDAKKGFALKNILDAAFAHPQGILGRLGGLIMARSTKERNQVKRFYS